MNRIQIIYSNWCQILGTPVLSGLKNLVKNRTLTAGSASAGLFFLLRLFYRLLFFDLNGPANDLDVPAQYSQTDITFESSKTMIRTHVQAMILQGID